jgi:hypothetical protein
MGARDWEWDFSLTGPVKVYLVDDDILDIMEGAKIFDPNADIVKGR